MNVQADCAASVKSDERQHKPPRIFRASTAIYIPPLRQIVSFPYWVRLRSALHEAISALTALMTTAALFSTWGNSTVSNCSFRNNRGCWSFVVITLVVIVVIFVAVISCVGDEGKQIIL